MHTETETLQNGSCVCQAWHGRANESSSCTPCPSGTYSPGNATGACTACPGSMNTSTTTGRSVVECTCPAGTGLGAGGYEGGCLACASGFYAPDAGPSFEFVGEGSCTGTCKHAKVLASEGACALECLTWPGCIGFTFTYITSVCELHWAAPREIDNSWSVVHSHE